MLSATQLFKKGDRLFVSMKNRQQQHNSVIYKGISHTVSRSKSGSEVTRESFPVWNDQWFDQLLVLMTQGTIEMAVGYDMFPMPVLTHSTLPIKVSFQLHGNDESDYELFLNEIVAYGFKLHHFRLSFDEQIADNLFYVSSSQTDPFPWLPKFV
jgi:hypothetical protein